MRSLVVTGCLLSVVFTCLAAAPPRPNFSGRWQLEDDPNTVVEIEHKGNSIKVVLVSAAGSPKTELNCAASGERCDAVSGGTEAKVSFWFAGPQQLVEMLLEGKNVDKVVKTTRTLSSDGKTFTAEIAFITPQKDPKKLVIQEISDEEEAEIQAEIAADPDNPEWTEEDFRRARPFAEVFPELIRAINRARGRL